MDLLLLLAAFVLIVGGAVGFTNAVEWLGHRVGLGEGAVGGLLAAVGTALPESLIPVIALISGGEGKEAEEIAIGAVIGAPFLLGTLAMLLVAIAARGFAYRRAELGSSIEPHVESTYRDLKVFLVAFPAAILIGAIGAPAGVRYVAAAGFVLVYAFYVRTSARGGGEAQEEGELKPLWFDASKDDPPNLAQIILQFAASLGAIIAGAEIFVHEIEKLAKDLGIGVLVLSLVLAPLATELPEKANSILWIRRGKDALAIGNITGAMVFQSTLPVALLLVLTTWELEPLAIAAALTGVVGGAVTFWAVRRRSFAGAPAVAWTALLVSFGTYAALNG